MIAQSLYTNTNVKWSKCDGQNESDLPGNLFPCFFFKTHVIENLKIKSENEYKTFGVGTRLEQTEGKNDAEVTDYKKMFEK